MTLVSFGIAVTMIAPDSIGCKLSLYQLRGGLRVLASNSEGIFNRESNSMLRQWQKKREK
ncbi:unnamed protein product [Schistosoma curassoni]|uniref:MFS transporter n=1 Tax=Schistosoma curassoni TaxID=6186 RepID=A0A183JVB4_9TREM|nr:unnamed protein product [Schistosoma curassoni]